MGDFVEVHAPEGDNQGLHNDGRHKYIVQLLELFEDKAVSTGSHLQLL